jgi:hypothetical protein
LQQLTKEREIELFEAPKGVVTLAFTDIQGSTRLWEHFGEVRFTSSLYSHVSVYLSLSDCVIVFTMQSASVLTVYCRLILFSFSRRLL